MCKSSLAAVHYSYAFWGNNYKLFTFSVQTWIHCSGGQHSACSNFWMAQSLWLYSIQVLPTTDIRDHSHCAVYSPSGQSVPIPSLCESETEMHQARMGNQLPSEVPWTWWSRLCCTFQHGEHQQGLISIFKVVSHFIRKNFPQINQVHIHMYVFFKYLIGRARDAAQD